MNPGHSYTIPVNEQIAAVMRQLWAEQNAAVQQAIQTYGRRGLLMVDLDRWKTALLTRLGPIYQQMVVQGKLSFAAHTTPVKRIKRGVASELFFGIPNQKPIAEVNEYLEVFDPNVEELARRYLYDFAASTLATSKLSVIEAYQQTADVMARGLSSGDTLTQISQQIGSIFLDPYRANMIAASESSRLYHGGQLITAKESGEVSGKTWLASADACERCLELNGKTVGIDEPFESKPGRYGIVMAPPLHPFCMCSITYELLPGAKPTLAIAQQAPEPERGFMWVPGEWSVWPGLGVAA